MREERIRKIRILALAILGFLLSIKSDRYFPFPENLPEPVFQTILLPYTCFFLGATILFLKPGIMDERCSFLDRISAIRLTTLILLVFEAGALVLAGVQHIRYASFGYHLDLPLAGLLFALIGITLVFFLFREPSPELLFFSALSAFGATYLVSIVSFPLNPQRSDMLPLIVSGCQSFLAGSTPYGIHSIPHHLVFTYLPGMWMAYLPAVASGIDPRFINLTAIILSSLILAGSNRNFQNPALLLLPVFLLTPYLQYRHEIYLGVLFLVLSILFALWSSNQALMSSSVFGYALATYQFTWVLYPFGVIAASKKWGIKKAVLGAFIAIAIALAIILPFFLRSPDYFIRGIYGHWLFVDVPTVNLSYLVSLLVPWDLMIFIQGMVMVIVLAAAHRTMKPEDCWGWMAFALVVFIALNRVIEVYFYLIVLLLLVMQGISTGSDKPRTNPVMN